MSQVDAGSTDGYYMHRRYTIETQYRTPSV